MAAPRVTIELMRGKCCCLVLLLPLAALGCGAAEDPHGRRPLTGTVKFQGAPVDGGSIRFMALQQDGLSAGALIRQGKYEVPREQGLPAGTYRVAISALEPTPTPTGAPGENPAPPAKERLPAEYNTDTMLRVEIKADQVPRFDFDLK
jgi:hypothetical protein